MGATDGARGAPPDVAALLARHPEPWTVGYLGGVYDADGATVGGREDGPSAATLVPLLATALRAALAECKRAEVGEDMASGCLVMIREDLEAMVGEDKMIGVPPMMYNDVIRTIYAQKEAALADQRRIDWLDTQRRPYSLPPTRMIVGTEWSVKLHHQEQPNATLRAAIDAAMTADGGGATAIGGARIVADETIPPNTAHVIVDGKHVGTITDLNGGGV